MIRTIQGKEQKKKKNKYRPHTRKLSEPVRLTKTTATTGRKIQKKRRGRRNDGWAIFNYMDLQGGLREYELEKNRHEKKKEICPNDRGTCIGYDTRKSKEKKRSTSQIWVCIVQNRKETHR
jgi:hypothetical protein